MIIKYSSLSLQLRLVNVLVNWGIPGRCDNTRTNIIVNYWDSPMNVCCVQQKSIFPLMNIPIQQQYAGKCVELEFTPC